MFTIPSPPWTTLGKTMESATRKALFEFDLLEGVSHLGVALSGGKDSLTLLFLLCAIRGKGTPPFSITAFHITGPFSCGASIIPAHLEEICRKLHIPLIIKKIPEDTSIADCYSCSRLRRKSLFTAASEHNIHHIAFGHHKDDAAQTTLMNLFHKGEFAGMLPKIYMVSYGVTIIRPLIFVNEADIRHFAKTYEFIRTTCKCPMGQNSIRKKTEQLLQEIEKIYPNATENVATAALRYGTKKAQRPSL